MSTSVPSFVMVIFGGSGDLTQRKLMPSLYRLFRDQLLPERFAIVGVARSSLTLENFREKGKMALMSHLEPGEFDGGLCQRFLSHLYYFSSDTRIYEEYSRLTDYLEQIRIETQSTPNFVFYLATPPFLFEPISKHLSEIGLLQEKKGWRRIVFEKPFGHNLESARKLNSSLLKFMNENQIYRIDHYLGKETVQNIMAFRFANEIFEPIWNRHYIDSVQISVAETIGVESRGEYYDGAGALQDMVPNHIFQLFSLIAMESPNSFESEDVRNEKVKLLRAIKSISPQSVSQVAVRGQYGAGYLNGAFAPGYREEPGVRSNSNTETFVALKLEVENWRWANVPFYFRTGKRLKSRITEIAILFKCPPFQMFQNMKCNYLSSNEFLLQIQPEEKMTLCFEAKQPGPEMILKNVALNLNYKDVFGMKPNTGYETLLHDCLKGDSTLFMRADQVDVAWSVVQPILDFWSANPPLDFPNYSVGTWGPEASEALLRRDGRAWRDLSIEVPQIPQTAAASRRVA